MDTNSVGVRIATLRKKSGYTLEMLAEILCVTPLEINKWENGHTLPETSLLPKLAQIFRCTIEEILVFSCSKDEGNNNGETKENLGKVNGKKEARKPNRKVENLMNAHVGSCGNRCDQCLLRATNGGIENRVLFTDECYKIYFSPDEAKENYSNVNCAGCYAGCKTKDCAKEKCIDLCVQCEDYPCEKVQGAFTYPGRCNVGLTPEQLDLMVIPYCGKERFERGKDQLCKKKG